MSTEHADAREQDVEGWYRTPKMVAGIVVLTALFTFSVALRPTFQVSLLSLVGAAFGSFVVSVLLASFCKAVYVSIR